MMKFLNFFKRKKQSSDYYCGLFLKHNSLEAFLYQKTDTALMTIAHKERTYSNGWNNIIEDTDDVLFGIEQDTKKEFDDVILYLHSHLVDAEARQIKEPYKSNIKDLLKKLELKPLGYIDCYEAVVTYLEKRDHTLLNSILVELDGDQVSVYLYMGGRQVYQNTFEKSSTLVDHLELEFTKMKQGSKLPSRLILFGEHEYQEEVDAVCAHEFEGKHFIQMPKVELFSKDDLAQALNETFRDQITRSPDPEIGLEEVSTAVPDENFEIVDHTVPVVPPKKEVMGFVIGDDAGEQGLSEPTHHEDVQDISSSDMPVPKKTNALSDVIPMIMGKVKPLFLKVKNMIPAKQGKVPYMIAGVVIVLLLGMFSIEYFFHKAQLTIYFPSQSISKDLSIPATLGANDINLKVGTVSAQVSDKKPTTGKRDVGEKAKGQVTIHNFEDNDHIFSKGTTLQAEGQSFVLDEEVKVASASEVLIAGGYVKQPGKATGSIIAANLGPASNLDKGKKFQIEDFSTSSYFAINDNPLTGGTQKEIKTVAKADIDTLRKNVISSGSKQAEGDIKKVQSTHDEQVLGALTEALPKKLDYSKEVGEEASEVKVDADIGVTYYTYSSEKLKKYLQKTLSEEVQDGFALPTEKIAYTVKNAVSEGDQVTLDVDAQGKALRKFSREDILKKIAGKNQKDLENILKNDFKATGFEVKNQSSPIFFLAGRMPMAQKNISITIDSL